MPNFEQGAEPGTINEPPVLRSGIVECACATDVGRTRSVNGDSAFIFLDSLDNTPFGFLAVADGTDGMFADGKLASSIALRKITQGILQKVESSSFVLPRAETLIDVFNEANQAIVAKSEAVYGRLELGTTFTCLRACFKRVK